MVIFVTSKTAYSEMEHIILSGKHPVWLTCDVLTATEYEALWKGGVDASMLNYEVNTSNEGDMHCAISTIKEHHPGKN